MSAVQCLGDEIATLIYSDTAVRIHALLSLSAILQSQSASSTNSSSRSHYTFLVDLLGALEQQLFVEDLRDLEFVVMYRLLTGLDTVFGLHAVLELTTVFFRAFGVYFRGG